nr:immunoglobulin heavy chain junction region [Mus musculus]MBK4189645.1 immunoglobulin heavy chain junction region [Mus musculus]
CARKDYGSYWYFDVW